jgi:thiol-disulfide isomerase/thioredoxin
MNLKMFGSMFVLFALVVSTAGAQENGRLKEGDAVPGFFLRDIKGGDFFLNDYVGEKAQSKVNGVLFSFCASWCKPCRKEIPELGVLYAKYRDKGIPFYLVNVGEDAAKAGELAAELKTSIPFLIDRYQKVYEKIGRPALPHTILVDSTGKVRFINTGFAESVAEEIIKKLDETLGALAAAGGASGR